MSAQEPNQTDGGAPLHRACLLLGSNIQPERNLPLAVELLRGRVEILQTSSVWESRAVGSRGPNFLNAALLCFTRLEASALKWLVLRPLEAQLGRVRNADKNAPRPIDIDVVTLDERVLELSLWQYSFRAVPVAELLPDLLSEAGQPLHQVAANLARETPPRWRPDVRLGSFQKTG